ncbi:MAG TPA: hypothetical protein VHB72_04245 [Candidatus Saccharimonadales bacterium]|nr:hypothetical protein [Candidatus Saccharimonadales bacterium]
MSIKNDQSGDFARPEPANTYPAGHIMLPGSADIMELAAEPEIANRQDIERHAARVAFRLPPSERDGYMESIRGAFPAPGN